MDPSESRKLYPYRVLTTDLTGYEIKDLIYHLDPDATDSESFRREYWGDAHVVKELFEFGLKHSTVLLPIAGAIGKSALDALVERVQKWLATRPEDRTVEIYGPDKKVVRIVKTGKEIRTLSREDSKDSRR